MTQQDNQTQDPSAKAMPTYGMQRVRVDFNPSGSPEVHNLKMKFAQLIDECNDKLKEKDGRSASIAMTELESACHWAVKAATA